MLLNTAGQIIGAQMVTLADGSPFTGPVTVYVTGDDGTQVVGSVGSGLCTHKGKGWHSYKPAQAETDYAHVVFTFEAAGAQTQSLQIYTDGSGTLVGSIAEPTGVPGFPATQAQMIAYLYASLTNKVTLDKTTGTERLRNRADSANIATRTVADDGTNISKTNQV